MERIELFARETALIKKIRHYCKIRHLPVPGYNVIFYLNKTNTGIILKYVDNIKHKTFHLVLEDADFWLFFQDQLSDEIPADYTVTIEHDERGLATVGVYFNKPDNKTLIQKFLSLFHK